MKDPGCFDCHIGQEGTGPLWMVQSGPAKGKLACMEHLPAETIAQYPGMAEQLSLSAKRSEQARKNFQR